MMLSLDDKEFVARIFHMTWTLVHCRKLQLLTTDNPVVYWHRPSPADRFSGIGLAEANVVRFPIDPTRVGTWSASGTLFGSVISRDEGVPALQRVLMQVDEFVPP